MTQNSEQAACTDPPGLPPALSTMLQSFIKDLNDELSKATVAGKNSEAIKANHDFQNKSGSEIVQIVIAYAKAYPQLKARFDALVAIMAAMSTDLEKKPEVKAKADAIKKKAKDLEHGLAELEKKFDDTEKKQYDQATAFNGAKLGADYAEKEFKEEKGRQKEWEDKLKAWEGLRDQAEKSTDKPLIAYVYVRVLAVRLEKHPLISPAALLKCLKEDLAKVKEARERVREKKLAFECAMAEHDEAKKNFESLEKTGIDDIIRDLEVEK